MAKIVLDETKAAVWRNIALTPVDEVLKIRPEMPKQHVSEFRNLVIDLSRGGPSVYARTLDNERFSFSVLDAPADDLDTFVGFLEWTKIDSREHNIPIKYQLGYERDMSRSAPQLKYVRLNIGEKIIEGTF